ncbi:arylsulfatase K isoform X2 [Mesoplodon densirostris]|uniref:arylsulfatase K isoform X2 n=1 Tax=Mesoplodon densirostris TaxID=48708 RepID=UPI0028DB8BA6|nr:arylsulfatase K isoform X2 [Mesoplodon densirostris]
MLLLWVAVVAVSALATTAPGAGGQRRGAVQAWPDAPNVVLVVSDSFDGRLTFYPGSQVVKLPFINFMKAHGTSFLNAYTNSPICCPSRAAMWSGLFTHLTESWNNFKGLDPNYTTWMDVMEKHGYRTQKFGKLDYTSGHHSISNRVEAWTRDVAFLLRQEGRPMVNLVPKKTKVSYDAIKIPKWSPLSEMHPIDYYSSYTKNCTGKFTEKEIKDIRAFYYAMCAETDAMLGEIILALHQLDLLQKTIVIYTSDHGELAMEHRQFYKMSMYEASAHVPLLIMGPGIKTNLQVSNVVSLVDVYPTMLDIAGIPLPQNLSGYSLLPLSSEIFKNEQKFKNLHPPWILSEFHGCNVNASAYMLRTNQWKYIAYSDGASVLPQLFDLSSDPDELTNIATQCPEVTSSLDQKLRSIINYPKVSASVHRYNKEQFIKWKQSIGQNYSNVIANLRWHQDWLKEPRKYENAIDQWLKIHSDPENI